MLSKIFHPVAHNLRSLLQWCIQFFIQPSASTRINDQSWLVLQNLIEIFLKHWASSQQGQWILIDVARRGLSARQKIHNAFRTDEQYLIILICIFCNVINDGSIIVVTQNTDVLRLIFGLSKLSKQDDCQYNSWNPVLNFLRIHARDFSNKKWNGVN